MQILGKIKNRYSDDRIEMPADIWVNKKYRIRLDETGEWLRVTKCYDLAMASVIELATIEL